MLRIDGRAPTNPNHQRQVKNREASSPLSRTGEGPARMTLQSVRREGVRGPLPRSRKHQPRTPTHWEPSRVVPGPHRFDLQGQQDSGDSARAIPAGPPAADFGTASPCGGRSYGGPADVSARGVLGDFLTRRAIQISLSLDNRCRGNCPTTLPAISSSCSPRRTWHAPAGSRAAPSIERLRAASCGRRGSVIGSGSNPPSWSDGSASRLSRPTHRGDLGGRGLPEMFRAVVCAPCSIRRPTDRRMR